VRIYIVIQILLITAAIVKFDLPCNAQLELNEIDLSRISQKKVRNLVQQQSLNGSKFFVDLKPTCYSESDSSNYSFQSSSHIIKQTILKVWNKLLSLKPKEEFSGKMVSFGFLYSKKLNKLFYSDDDKQDIEEGEVLFLNLKLLGGVKNIGVALEVTKVDEINKLIQFCYLNNGMTEGTQQIQLTGNDDGNTIITQETRYRNKSKFREKRLYPLFHQKAVNEMHSNLSRLIEGF